MLPEKISIIIPAYNAQRHLEACVDAVLKQTHVFHELILVDNRSSDATKHIIGMMVQRDPRIRYVYEAKRSRGAARNAGIQAATGNIIAMVDSDCLAPPTWLADLTRPIVHDGEEIAMGWEQDAVCNSCTSFIQEQNKRFLDQYRSGAYITTLDTKNCAFKACVLRENYFDSEIGNLEDFELALRLRNRYKIRFLEEVRVWHYHQSTAWFWMKLQFDRGFWARQIYKKHKGSLAVEGEAMFESLKPLNMLAFPFWMVYQFFKKPSRKIWLAFVSELGWRMGLVWGRPQSAQ